MTNSKLIDDIILSPNHSGLRNEKITKIAIHHAAGIIKGRDLAKIFLPRQRQASSNYMIGSDGKIILGVDETNRAWTTSSSWCDNRAITIEVGNSTRGVNWEVSDFVLNRLIDLVTDICRRNNIYPCTYTGNKNGVLQKHEWYANTNCPGPYLGNKFAFIASEVNKRLDKDYKEDLYRVRKSFSDKKSQKGAFKSIDNAKKCADKYRLRVFDEGGNEIYPRKNFKLIDTLAREVIRGDWGNGNERKKRLTDAGYDYYGVQRRVNQILS
ncbi:N-acetylmuramoyl-L-alanine amidase [Anaerococcus hydrogenalis]|uniref:N-acetylmuramoyl-L-alanine amidase n=1 Tax=Anaerococcus hydrogenalis TaxID=33029 RepID=UPI002889CA82|nr:N-acetylmuramoyl-L-alanine amidase [Anaerococcus hydrogenalis]